MSGHIGGVQTLMRQQYPFAYFVHYAAHRLNLVLSQAVSSISPVKVFFASVGYFSTFSTSSPHRKAFFMANNIEIPSPGETRWYYRARTIDVIFKNYQHLHGILKKVNDNPFGLDDDSIKFLSNPAYFMQFCRGGRPTSTMACVKSFLGSIRNDVEFDMNYQKAVDKAGSPVTRIDLNVNYKQLYFQVLDTIVGMLNERFKDIQSFGFLDLVNPKLFRNWGGKVPSDKIDLLKESGKVLSSLESNVGVNDYGIKVGDKVKTFHANMLKEYVERQTTQVKEREEALPKKSDREIEGSSVLHVAAAAVIEQSESGPEGAVDDESLLELGTMQPKETVRDVTFGQQLNDEQKVQLQEVVKQYEHVFTDVPGNANIIEHEVKRV
ncbi:zinc finger MYM-type 1-like [Paramuricea clavata]|uniref:Zinc finger MYM-type 1-like n=1 Tax=Paramuricea clavata TaxID=317549 RepID=A0A6S7GKM4_PARCT|nr:zinc finger MYM-type 1-like [Paramuricea clavata]